MKNAALLVGVLVILSGLGWYLFNSVPTAEAPTDVILEDEPATVPADTVEPGTDVSANSAVSSFADCVAAGNPVMESYPRQCRHAGELFVEDVTLPSPTPLETVTDAFITCSPESKLAELCTMEYAPVCGSVAVQCVTTPCEPVLETFSNACQACAQPLVTGYTAGACTVSEA